MRKNSLLATPGVILLVLFLSACGEIVPKFDKTPKITFESIRTVPAPAILGDSVIVTFKFQDGDGDIGTIDNSAPNDFFAVPFKIYNKDTINVVFDPGPGVSYDGRLPQMKDNGKPGPIEGTVEYRIAITPPLISVLDPSKNINPGDTILFDIEIKDQAGRVSNKIKTTGIQVLTR